MLREPLSMDIAYPMQWHESRVNLTELAKLRYIHGWSRQELARHYGRTLNAITNYCQSIRRKNFDLDGLTTEEKEQIKWAIKIDFFIGYTGIFGCRNWEFAMGFKTSQKSPVRTYSGFKSL